MIYEETARVIPGAEAMGLIETTHYFTAAFLTSKDIPLLRSFVRDGVVVFVFADVGGRGSHVLHQLRRPDAVCNAHKLRKAIGLVSGYTKHALEQAGNGQQGGAA